MLRGSEIANLSSHSAKPTEPPPPFPPPPPFVPLDSNTIDDQIGILKQFYQSKANEISTSLAAAAPPPPPILPLPPSGPGMPYGLAPIPHLAPPLIPPLAPPPIPSLPSMPVNPADALAASAPHELPPTVVIPDDAPSPSHAKIGPLGTINKVAPSGNATKKKSKAKPPAPAPGPSADGDAPPATPGPPAPPLLMASSSNGEPGPSTGPGKKGKGAGTPSKKKAKVEAFPPVVMASA